MCAGFDSGCLCVTVMCLCCLFILALLQVIKGAAEVKVGWLAGAMIEGGGCVSRVMCF